MKASIILIFGFYFALITSNGQSAKEIIEKAYEINNDRSNFTEMTMTIVRPTWKRTIGFKTWSKTSEFSMALVTEPAKEKGQTFLKRGNEMWNWVPSINRMIKLPPSMMSQGWMGSDFSNDDLLKESSIVKDFEHSFLEAETFDNKQCYKIKLVPKPDAAVVWGALVKWISKDGLFQLKTEYYDEDNLLVKTELASNIRQMHDRQIPTHFEIVPTDKPGNKTLLDIVNVKFNIEIEDGFFSQQRMKNVGSGQ